MTKTKRLKVSWKSLAKGLRQRPGTMLEIFLHKDDATLSGYWTKAYMDSHFDFIRLFSVEDMTWKKSSA